MPIETSSRFNYVFDTVEQLLAASGYKEGDLGNRALVKTTGMVYYLFNNNPTQWILETSPRITFGSGIPFIVPSSGTVSNTVGNITTAAGLDYVPGPSYTFFPAGALYASSPSGWYYTNWTAATLAVVYADMYTSGVPEIPVNPTPLTTVAGAYTQTTGVDIFGPSYAIPGGFLGQNGFIEWNRVVNNPSNANNKVFNMFFGGVLFQGYTQTANPKAAGQGTIKNRGRSNAQISASAAYGDNGNASSLPKLSINTNNTQVIAFAVYIANAADYAIIESHFVRANKV